MASPVEDWKPHLGRKVSLRYKLDDPDHPFNEAIGVVASVSADQDHAQLVTILTRNGSTKTIPAGDIVAAKLFPL